MTDSRRFWKRGFTIFSVLAFWGVSIGSSGCALHTRQSASVRALEEAAESTPEVPNVEPPKID